jgi:hypothetical protein
VEAQHLVSTRKLVDSDAEHEALEALIEASKPALPPAAPGRRGAAIHYLLATPFRYPPLRHGSRFGSRGERGIWYGADAVPTALAEVAYYRLLFAAGTAAAILPLTLQLSVFQAQVATAKGVDLSRPPFSRYRARVSSPTSYDASQRLGAEMRADGVQACRYASARDPAGGTNVAVFTPDAFARRTPSPYQVWLCTVADSGVAFQRADPARRERVAFAREAFVVDGALPRPAV